jgi:hypothetical protein
MMRISFSVSVWTIETGPPASRPKKRGRVQLMPRLSLRTASCSNATSRPAARTAVCGAIQDAFDHGLKAPITQGALLLQVEADDGQIV